MFRLGVVLHYSITSSSLTLQLLPATAHHHVIQKEVDEPLAMGAIEPSTGGAGFYPNVFVVPKYMGTHTESSMI